MIKGKFSGLCFLFAAACLGALPGLAFALGLGEIDVKSAGEHGFFAEVPVILTDDESNLTATVGDERDYAMMQLQRPDFLDHFHVRVVNDNTSPTGKVLHVISKDRVSKPSFNLIITATANGGTIMENYFLAMDFKKTLSLEVPPAPEPEPEEAKAEPEKKTLTPSPSHPAPATKEMDRLEKVQIAESRLPDDMAEEETGPQETETQDEPEEQEEVEPVKEEEPEPGMAYRVERGDTLYGLARQLSIAKNDRGNWVREVFRANPRAFIANDPDRLMAGATLEIPGSGDLAPAQPTSAITETTPAPRKTAKTAPAVMDPLSEKLPVIHTPITAFELPITEDLSTAEIHTFLALWLEGWEKKDHAALRSMYSSGFTDSRGRGRDSFLASREAFNNNKENIRVSLENLSIVKGIGRATVYFTQWFRSDTFSSVGLKKMRIKKTTAGLKISSEDFFQNKAIGRDNNWCIYVAYTSDREMADKMIQSLRAAGFEAFEASSFQEEAYRILIGRAPNKGAAMNLEIQLKEEGRKTAKIVSMPFALEAGMFESEDKARQLQLKLVQAGLSPYRTDTRTLDGRELFGVYIGAYPTPEQAEEAAKAMQTEEIKLLVAKP